MWRWIFVIVSVPKTLVYSHLLLGFWCTGGPKISFCGDSLLDCFIYFLVFFSLFSSFRFILCCRRRYRASNGSTACLPGAFVLKGFLTSQPKNTQSLILPQGKMRAGYCLVEWKLACTPSMCARCGMLIIRRKEGKSMWMWSCLFFYKGFFASSSFSAAPQSVGRRRIRARGIARWGQRLRFVHHKVCPETGMMCERIYIGLAGRGTCFLSCRGINHSSGPA